MNKELRKVDKWLTTNRLALYVDKSHFVLFHSSSNITHSKQASNIYLLTQVEGLAGPDGAGVDLRLGCPRFNILERISLNGCQSVMRIFKSDC